VNKLIMHELIEQLKDKQWLWHGNKPASLTMPTSLASTGFAELDQKLEGGMPEQGVIDIQSPPGIGELRLLFPHLRHADDGRLLVFIQPPAPLYAEALVSEQLDNNRILVIQPKTQQHGLWAAEQCLKSGACSHVMLWCDKVEIHQARRFQVSAEMGRCRQFLFRNAQQQGFSLPVSLSMQLAPHPQGIEARITKRKGRWEPNPFTINMAQQWPTLVLQARSQVVVPFAQPRSKTQKQAT
jgi:hypothetical protein